MITLLPHTHAVPWWLLIIGICAVVAVAISAPMYVREALKNGLTQELQPQLHTQRKE